jgi:hypothetical protein
MTSISVAKALNGHPHRADIIQERPDITVKQAEKEIQQWKQAGRAQKKKSAAHSRKSKRTTHTGRLPLRVAEKMIVSCGEKVAT